MTASYLLWVFSGSFALFIASRLLGGVMSGNISVATAAMADSTTSADRAKGMGMGGAAFGLGFILGPALGGMLCHVRVGQQGGILNPFAAVAAGALLLSLTNWIWVATRFEETLGPAERTRRPGGGRTINPARLFARSEFPGVRRTNILWFLYLLGFSGMEFTLTFLAADRFAYGPRDNAYLLTFSGLILVFVQGGLIRRLAPVYGEKRLVIVGLALLVPGFLLTGLAPRQGSLYLGLAVVSLGSALLTPAATALVSLYATADRQGSVLGVFRSLGALARAFGPILACLAYWQLGREIPYVAGASLLVVPLGLALTLPAPRR
jgi:MFS family permease